MEVEWWNIKQDSPILVSKDGKRWVKRYFAMYKNNKVYAYNFGMTEWSSNGKMKEWNYARLAGDMK